MKHSAYPKYKKSGVEWLGDVPHHWNVKRTRFMVAMNPTKQEINHLPPETEVQFLPMESVSEDGSLNLETTRPIFEVSSGYTYFAEGDVTFAKITPCFENGKGAIMRNLQNSFGFGTTELTVIRPGPSLNNEYLYYLTISRDFRKNGEAWMYGAGGQKRVPDDFVHEFRLAFPPLSEQQAIADFLDCETGLIDSLNGKKQKFVELLKEKRTALISRAVTKGLNPKVKMKPSGVEWLGDVPEHWEVKQARRCLLEHKQGYYTTDAYVDNGYKLLRITDLDGNGFVKIDDCPSVDIKDEAIPFLLRDNDFVFARTGGAGSFGLVKNLKEKTVFASYLIRFRFSKNTYADFLRYSFLSKHFVHGIIKNIHGGVNQNVHAEDIKDQFIPLPPLPEQQAIADFLDCETGKIDMLMAKVETAIETLKEYRTALISAAVTGKIDVSTGLNTGKREVA